MKQELKIKWLKAEKRQENFIGWDFSAIENSYCQEKNTWNYSEIVNDYLKPSMRLLDMGTGGGELLATFHHPFELTSVTEGWEKNYQLLLEKLAPKGVNVQFVKEDDVLPFSDNSFDIVVNSHESFSTKEVKRVLKSGGIFISQQVGDLNGVNLASRLIPNFKKEKFDFHLSVITRELDQAGFDILYENECYPVQRFFDMEALIYYVKTIEWEFPEFSVENNFQELMDLQKELARNGSIYNSEHRFIFVARLGDEKVVTEG